MDESKVRLTVPAILDKLDAVDDSRFRNRRSGDRIRFRQEMVPAKVSHPGGSTSERVVATRNLSSSGIGFIYDSFLHNGTRVVLQLKRKLGGSDAIAGKVVYCAHVSGAFHQIGVRFDQKIFDKLYLDDRTPPVAAGAVASPAAATGAALNGRLLVVDAQAMDCALVAHHLRETQLQVVTVADEPSALAALRMAGASFSAVLCELDVGADFAAQVIINLREAGHRGAIVAATPTKIDAASRERAAAIGITALVNKPYERTELLATLAAQMKSAGQDATAAAIGVVQQGVTDVRQLVDVCRSVK